METRKIWHTLVFCSSGNSGSHLAFYGSQMAPFSKSILWLCRCVPYWLFSGSGYKIKQRKQTLIKMSHITQVVLSSNTWRHHQLWPLSKFCIIVFFLETLLVQAVFNSINSVWTFTCPSLNWEGKQLNVEKVNLRYLAHYNQIRLVHASARFPWTYCEQRREKG